MLRACALLALSGPALLACASASAPELTAQERQWLEDHRGRVVLAVETHYAPFVFQDRQDRTTGLAHEHLLAMEAKLGLRFERRVFSSLDEIFAKVRAGEVQVVNAVTRTAEREKFLAFTQPFIAVPNVLVVRKQRQGALRPEDFAGERVSLVKSYAITEHLLAKNPGFVPVIVPDDLSALLNVSFGRTEAAIVDLATATHLIEAKSISNLRVAAALDHDIQLAMAASTREPLLQGILEKGLAALGEDERRTLRARWFNTEGGSPLRDRHFWAIVVSILLVLLAAFSAVTGWNRMLKRQVALRTDELGKLNRTLQEQKRLMQAVVDHSSAAIFAHDRDGRCLMANRVIEELVGTPATNIVGKTFHEVAPRPVADVLEAHHREVLTYGLPTEREEALPTDAGLRVFISLRVPLRDATGEIYAVCGVAADITERKRLEDERRQLLDAEHGARLQAEAARGQAEALSNEVRALYAQLAEVEEAERRSLARDLHDSIGQLLPLALRRVQRTNPSTPTPASEAERVEAAAEAERLLHDAIEQTRTLTFGLYPTILDDLGLVPALRWHARQLATEGLTVTVSESTFNEKLPLPLATFLFRAAVELLRNVVKHAKASQALVVVYRENDVVRVLVSDDGRAFAPGSPTGGSSRPGMGLGLFDIRQRASILGGRLTVEFAPGEGTMAVLEVPVEVVETTGVRQAARNS